MKFFLILAFIAIATVFPITVSEAKNDPDCLCIASETVKKYCEREKTETPKNEYRINQEAIAVRDIQRLINHDVGADQAKDAEASQHNLTKDFTVKDLDGKIWTREEMKSKKGAAFINYEGILRIIEDTYIKIECLTLKGKEAIVFTNQHFVRYMPDRKDESPHEIITNIIHREIWVFTQDGWKIKHIEELERGKTYLDGKLYDAG